MANPTTNYGFVLPTASDLVTDLPADFDVALQGVDTRLKALQPGTTLGDLAYSSATANTNTRLAVGSTGQVLTVAGGVPTWAAPNAGGTWQAYSPTYTNLTVGNGTVVARYTQSGKLITVFFSIVFGSTTSLTGGTPAVSLPANCAAGFNELVVVFGKCEDTGTAFYNGGAMIIDPDRFRWQVFPTNGAFLTSDNVSPTNPMTWTTGDKYSTSFTYEGA